MPRPIPTCTAATSAANNTGSDEAIPATHDPLPSSQPGEPADSSPTLAAHTWPAGWTKGISSNAWPAHRRTHATSAGRSATGWPDRPGEGQAKSPIRG